MRKWAIIVGILVVCAVQIVIFGYYVNQNYKVEIFARNEQNDQLAGAAPAIIDKVLKVSPAQRCGGFLGVFHGTENVEPGSFEVAVGASSHPFSGARASVNVEGLVTAENYQKGSRISTDCRGFRSKPMGPKRDNRVRIAITGASVPWNGLTNDTTIIGFLAKKIAERGVDVEFINASMQGVVVSQEYGVFVHDLVDMEPDLVVTFSGISDIHTYGFVDAGIRAQAWAHYFYPPVAPVNEPTIDQVREVLGYFSHQIEKMARISKEFDISYIAVLQPHARVFPDKGKEVSEDLNIFSKFFLMGRDLWAEWDEKRRWGASYMYMGNDYPIEALPDTGHPAKEILTEWNEEVAGKIFKHLDKNGVIDKLVRDAQG